MTLSLNTGPCPFVELSLSEAVRGNITQWNKTVMTCTHKFQEALIDVYNIESLKFLVLGRMPSVV